MMDYKSLESIHGKTIEYFIFRKEGDLPDGIDILFTDGSVFNCKIDYNCCGNINCNDGAYLNMKFAVKE
jgi:hypothetical protein